MRPSRRRLLQGGAAALFGSFFPARRAWAATDRVLVLYWAAGGWDTSFVFDPHPDVDTVEGDEMSEVIEASGLTFAHSDSRPAVRSFFEDFGSEAVIINGVAVGSISHDRCTRIMLTGGRAEDLPDLATLVGATSGEGLALPSVLLSGPRFPGELGAASVALNPTLTGTVLGELPIEATYSPDREALLRAYLAEEAAVRSERATMATYASSLSQMGVLEAEAEALELPDGAGFSEQLDAGLQSLSRGLSRVIVIQGTNPVLSQWDSHISNDDLQDRNFEHAFGELQAIMEGLEGLSAPGGGSLRDQAMVLAMSEMGRTPVHNAAGGKDHWPYTSLMAVGAGVRGGQVVGLTDDTLTGQKVNLATGAADDAGELLTSGHVAAGVLQAFGVDPSPYHPDTPPLEAAFREG